MQSVLKLVVTAAVVVATAITAGCKKDQSTTGDSAQAAMGLYAAGYNVLLEEGNQALRHYRQDIPDAGPDLKHPPHLFPGALAADKRKEASDSFTKAKAAAPASIQSLAPLADQLLATAEQVGTIYEEAFKYYDAERYKDDAGAKGKDIHTRMLAASKAFTDGLDAMGDAMSTVEDQQMETELGKYAAAKGYSYWFRYYNQQAKKFVTLVDKANDAEKVAKLRAAYAPLEQANQDIAAFVAGKGQDVVTAFSATYPSAADRFDTAVTKLLRLADSKQTLADPEAARAVDAVISAYNGLITIGNSLYKVEAAGVFK